MAHDNHRARCIIIIHCANWKMVTKLQFIGWNCQASPFFLRKNDSFLRKSLFFSKKALYLSICWLVLKSFYRLFQTITTPTTLQNTKSGKHLFRDEEINKLHKWVDYFCEFPF